MSIFSRSISIRRALPLMLVLAACPAEDEPIPAAGGSSSGGMDESTTDPGATSEAPTSSEGTSEDEPSTGDPPLDGECIGFTATSNIGTVLARDGMPIDTTCGLDPAPCGGDPVGTWTIEGVCGFQALPNPWEDICPGSEFYAEQISLEGTYTFEADGTYIIDIMQELAFHIVVDAPTCFGQTCAEYEAESADVLEGITCQEEAGGCHCVFGQPPASSTSMGTWEAMDEELTFEEGGLADSVPFCVEGDRFDLWQSIYNVEATGLLCAESADCEVLQGYDFALCSTELPEDPGG